MATTNRIKDILEDHPIFTILGIIVSTILITSGVVWSVVNILIITPKNEEIQRFQRSKEDQDSGAKAADLNGRVEKLRFKVDELAQDISDLKRVTPSSKISPEVASERETRRQVFEQNSTYSVLVFHKPEQQATASALADALLSAGFKSSATSTYLTEAIRRFKPDEAWVIYTSRGKEKLPDVKRIFMATAPNVHYIEEPQPSNLQRGDIQILLF
jgi:hypothetical protein